MRWWWKRKENFHKGAGRGSSGDLALRPSQLHADYSEHFWESVCASVGRADYELMIERLAVQILPPTAHMSEVSMGKTLNPELLPMGAGSTLHGSSYPMVCECVCVNG